MHGTSLLQRPYLHVHHQNYAKDEGLEIRLKFKNSAAKDNTLDRVRVQSRDTGAS